MSPFLTRLVSLGPNKGRAKAQIPSALTNGSISGSSNVGSTLTYTTATFRGTPAPSVSWIWYRGATPVQTGGSTYTLVSGDSGFNITVQATASNAAGSVTAISNSITATTPAPTSVQYLVVAGGAGGGLNGRGGGGGGAGGYLTSTYPVSPGSSYTIQVGGGGGQSSDGTPSYFGPITSYGGGTGNSVPGNPGGSGGGSQCDSPNSDYFKGGNGTPGQGNPGGSGNHGHDNPYTGAGGGGGGIGGAGGSVALGYFGSDARNSDGGSGGSGADNSITGTNVHYAAGGGGGTDNPGRNGGSAGGPTAGSGGRSGDQPYYNGGNGQANTGSGGGGSADRVNPTNAGSGGSGRVVIRYPDAYAVASSTTGTSSSGAPSGGYRTYIWDGSGSITF